MVKSGRSDFNMEKTHNLKKECAKTLHGTHVLYNESVDVRSQLESDFLLCCSVYPRNKSQEVYPYTPLKRQHHSLDSESFDPGGSEFLYPAKRPGGYYPLIAIQIYLTVLYEYTVPQFSNSC